METTRNKRMPESIWKPPPKWPEDRGWMLAFDSFNAVVAMGLVGLLAVLFHAPLIFPSLGATAYLLFAHPHEQQAQARSAVLAHTCGAIIGWLAFKIIVVGIGEQPPSSAVTMLQPGAEMPAITIWLYVVAAALSIGLSLAVMVRTHTEHAPACSTALIFSMGLFQYLWQIGVLIAGVFLLVLLGKFLNRLIGYEVSMVSG